MIGRRDKAEHTLCAQMKVGYWACLHHHFICNTESFRVLRWSADQTLRYFRTNYHVNYPQRFKNDHHAEVSLSMIPDAVVRKKAKCWSAEEGLICDRPHVHERLLVDTSRLPLHASDRLFSRSWSLSKKADPWPSKELWSLRDARRRLQEERAPLVFIPEFRFVCACCRREKEELTHARIDVDNM